MEQSYNFLKENPYLQEIILFTSEYIEDYDDSKNIRHIPLVLYHCFSRNSFHNSNEIYLNDYKFEYVLKHIKNIKKN